MRIFLTGAGGFLGAAIAAAAVRRGDRVTCLVRPQTDLWRLAPFLDRVAIAKGDLDDPQALEHHLIQAAPDTVCHAAWKGVAGSARNDPEQDANIASTALTARLAAVAGAQAFVGIGSQAEYGPLNRIAHEDDPLKPTNRYGTAKVAAQRQAAAICAEQGLRFAWLRVFSLYGPRDSATWLLPYTILALLRGERPALTAAEQYWDFLHVADAARAVCRVISCKANGVFNLGSGQAQPLRRTLEMTRDLVDPSLPLGFGEVAYRADQIMWLQADIARLEALGWHPEVTLEQGLRETIAWLRSR